MADPSITVDVVTGGMGIAGIAHGHDTVLLTVNGPTTGTSLHWPHYWAGTATQARRLAAILTAHADAADPARSSTRD